MDNGISGEGSVEEKQAGYLRKASFCSNFDFTDEKRQVAHTWKLYWRGAQEVLWVYHNRHKSNIRVSILCNWCFHKKSAIIEACYINFFSMYLVWGVLDGKVQHYELNMMIILLLTLSYNDALHYFLFWFDWMLWWYCLMGLIHHFRHECTTMSMQNI